MTQIASQEDVDKILKHFYLVYFNIPGYGFLKGLSNALYFELIRATEQCKCKNKSMYFIKNHKKVGRYYADMVINNSIILELKRLMLCIKT